MNIIKRIKAKTSKGNRLKGQVSTLIGTSCGVVLGLGIVTIASPLLFAALTIGSIFFGGDAVKRMMKTEEKQPKNGND